MKENESEGIILIDAATAKIYEKCHKLSGNERSAAVFSWRENKHA